MLKFNNINLIEYLLFLQKYYVSEREAYTSEEVKTLYRIT